MRILAIVNVELLPNHTPAPSRSHWFESPEDAARFLIENSAEIEVSSEFGDPSAWVIMSKRDGWGPNVYQYAPGRFAVNEIWTFMDPSVEAAWYK